MANPTHIDPQELVLQIYESHQNNRELFVVEGQVA